MAAETLAGAGATVTVFERMPSVGRKLLLAGRGGLNLTHSEPLDQFLPRYGDRASALQSAIEGFGPDDLRGWSDDGLAFATTDEDEVVHRCDATVLALGGASWPRSGSDGTWVEAIEHAGITVAPLRPANGGFVVNWSPDFAARFAGVPLKNVALSVDGPDAGPPVRAEAMITATGIEGGGVYALSRLLRDAIDGDGRAILVVDLLPDRMMEHVVERLLGGRPKDSASNALRRSLGLSPVAVGLLREATANRLPSAPEDLAQLIKAAPIELTATQPIDRAISTAGGIRFNEIDDRFMLPSRPGTFVAGEMLDWEAPTGGYLLQASFSTGVAAARGALSWLDHPVA